MCTFRIPMARPNTGCNRRLNWLTGLDQRQLREARLIVETHLGEIKNAWNHHFGA